MSKKNKNIEVGEDIGVTPIKARKTKIDFIPDDMIDEFNEIQAALAAAKGNNKRDITKLTPEELQARRDKAAKRLAALEAALGTK